MKAILRDSHLDIRIKRYIPMNVIVPKLEYAGEVWDREREVGEAVGNSTDEISSEESCILKKDE